MAVPLIRKIATFFGDPTGDVSQQSLFLLTSPSMKTIMSLCPPKVLQQVYEHAISVKTSHWLQDTRQFASDFITELITMDATFASSPPSLEGERAAEEARRKKTWKVILGRTSSVL
jgi:hypothetical protein